MVLTTLASAAVVIEAIEFVEEMEKVKGYWDDKGLDMHIAVKKSKFCDNGDRKRGAVIAVSTKHWARVHYLYTQKTAKELWANLAGVAGDVGRSLVKGAYGPYVYIPKLSVNQTQDIFNRIRACVGSHDIKRKFQFSWKIDDAVLEEFC